MKKNIKAFTLVELVVAITIFFAMVVTTYIPYAFYQNKAKVNITVKNISQSISEARNLSVNGLEKKVEVIDTSVVPNVISYPKKNLSVGILISNLDKKQIQYYAYPYDMDIADIRVPEYTGTFGGTDIELPGLKNMFLVESKPLLYPIRIAEIKTIDNSGLEEIKDHIFILFDAIKGTSTVYKINTNDSISKLSDINEIKISAAFKNATPGPLRKELTYTPKTNLIDY